MRHALTIVILVLALAAPLEAHGPGTPICSVQCSAEISMIGWTSCVASVAPKNSGTAAAVSPGSARRLIQTWSPWM